MAQQLHSLCHNAQTRQVRRIHTLTMQSGFHFPKDGSSGSHSQHSEKPAPSNADLLKLLQTQKQQRLQLARDPVYHAYHAAEKQRMIKLKKKGWTEPVKPRVLFP